MAANVKEIALIQGHPDPEGSHFCHALAEAYRAGAKESAHFVHTIDVARLSFPLLRSRDELERRAPDSILEAQRTIATSDHIVMIYPVWNGTLPALLKGFLEQTFRPAFMFPDASPGERLGFSSAFTQRKSLKGKTARIVVTMQMPAFIYRWGFHPRPDKSPLRLAGIGSIRESLIGLVESPDGTRRGRWLKEMQALGRRGE